MVPLQCPGEPYTITRLICRNRQAKGYGKCPGCQHRNREEETPTAVPIPTLQIQDLMVRRLAPVAGRGSGEFRSLLRRIYDYF